MDHFENAVAELAVAASVDDAYACAQRLLAELDWADAGAQQRALGRLADVLPTAPLDCAGVVALACGALVERGGDPERPLDALLGRLPEVLAGAAAFADACRVRAKADDGDDAIERYGDEVAKTMPAEAVAWGALDLFASAVIAVLARSPAARRRARARPELAKRAGAVGDLHGTAKFPGGTAARARRRRFAGVAPGVGPRLEGARRRNIRQFPAAYASGRHPYRRSGKGSVTRTPARPARRRRRPRPCRRSVRRAGRGGVQPDELAGAAAGSNAAGGPGRLGPLDLERGRSRRH